MLRLLAVVVVLFGAFTAVGFGVPAVYIFGPLLGLTILMVGRATFNSLSMPADHVPQGDPVPVDPRDERTVYWCPGCGAEVLLLVRGTPLAPRHCGEKMTERQERLSRGPRSQSD